MEMGEWLKVVLSLSLSGTLLFLVLLALKRLFGKRVSKCWQYYILLAVALRFLVPFSPDTTIVGFLFETAQNAVKNASVNAAADTGMGRTGAGVEHNDVMNADSPVIVGSQPVSNGNPAFSDSGTVQPSDDIWLYAFFVWSAIALTLMIRKVTIYQGFLRYVRAGSQEVSDLETLNLLSDCMENLQNRRTVGLYKNPLIASPMAVGFFHPRIILPKRAAGAQELRYIFTHELTHLKRWDLVYKWIVQIAVCMHWFNPFVYLLEREVTRACELSCDEAVIHTLDDTEKKAYGDTLLLFLKTDDAYKSSLASVTLTEGAKELKERLGAIMEFHKKSKAVTAVTAVLTILVCVCFQSLGVYAMQGRGQKADFKEKTAEEKLLGEELADEALTEEQKADENGEKSLYDSVLYDENENAFYILYDGAQMIDVPDSSFSDGTIGIVLVRADGYTSLGPFTEGQNLAAQVKQQLDVGMAKGYYTQREMDIALKAARQIELSDGWRREKENQKQNQAGEYTFMQSAYYEKPFVIVLAQSTGTRNIMQDLGEDPNSAYQKEITLADDSKRTVYFTQEAEQVCQAHQEAYAAVGTLLHQIDTRNSGMQIKMTLVRRIDYVEENRVTEYVQECYEKEDLLGFSAVLAAVDETVRTQCYDKIYRTDQVAFFSVAADAMSAEQLALYADQAYEDNKIAFFAILCDRIGTEQLQTFANSSYEQGDIAKFSIVVSHLTREEQKEWLLRAQSDKKISFAAVLGDKLNEFDNLNDFDNFNAFNAFDAFNAFEAFDF